MAVLASTIKPSNLYLKHTNGTVIVPTSVLAAGENFQYTVENNWQESDSGVWSIWLDENNAVLDAAGNKIVAQKIGELTVSIIGVAQYVVIVNFSNLSGTIRSDKDPDVSLAWEAWHKVVKDYAAKTLRVSMFMRVDSYSYLRFFPDTLADEYLELPLEDVVPTHAQAIAVGSDFKTTLPYDFEFTYPVTLDAQNGSRGVGSFPAGRIRHVRWEGWVDTQYWDGASDWDLEPTATAFDLQPFAASAVINRAVWTFTYSDGSAVTYSHPITR